ncbi:molybdenum ABC transporter, periplasmic molybdate-binding protein [Desulfovibrio sp. X2]|uniref:molybdate ABC transporter substrate-binding protein n=1 Tax=Desulfovibrio sp. X2 TaxID=941449 RepID=UPI000358C054|nr:molybdate ABC transporter substrate-binding protein [Desulfovibrio sp. X2]EPR41766.1 molybdenum ABC transporter, periplasmic molybdate-binding protein [Desulfovibrio sp. X2]
MKRIILALVLVLGLAVPAAAEELVVSAAASLTDAFTTVKTAFEKANPGVTVTTNYAASGALYKQIEQGAPVDVFASANMKWMEKMVEGGFVDKAAPVVFAVNDLVLAVPHGNPAKVSSVDDLMGAAVKRVAIGTPKTVPAGNYAMVALQDMGKWDALQQKLVFGESVRQVLDYVARGEVEAGFVYATDAKRDEGKVDVATVIALKKPVTYPIAVLKSSKQSALAKKFIDYVRSPEGQKILAGYGFSAPK